MENTSLFEEIIKSLKKYKWKYLGHDKLECAESFLRKKSFYVEKIYVNNFSFRIEAFRTDGGLLERHSTSAHLDLEELKLFTQLFEYLKEGGSVNLELATNQEDLDAAYNFEKWW